MLYRNKIEQELGVLCLMRAPLPEDVELELSRVAKEAAQTLRANRRDGNSKPPRNRPTR